MATKQSKPHPPIGDALRDNASSVAVTMDSDRIAADEDVAKVATATNTNPRWKWYLIFFGLQLSVFSTILEFTIVSTALPKIGSELDAISI
ncbi:hypothetical protein O0I10_001528 [Lichtheimia ornata]|uniref:Major facilitator superfamily (MFS) profile domain-containing protein n=1 Tax=Lichtheimia ornata TaxID=688661 RepID=A0AAD7VCX3_9FUNG|nr:uncharacterized protein O0I10_001528 [Lichtheimia ornata]KAJ8662567.1 hypothetical protein O0I10_001528 [Lichtheimia ornata]